jgi:ribosomal protein S18 acetylase RimI-like enzyme
VQLINEIKTPSLSDAAILSDMGRRTFLDAHSHSASPVDITHYIETKYRISEIETELKNPDYIYRLIYKSEEPAGYSKIILNTSPTHFRFENSTKLERLYIEKKFYGLNFAQELLKYNIMYSKSNHQKGMWLFVWIENLRAIAFYKKLGFDIVGAYNFEVSPTHSNPNHIMYLEY